MYMWYPFGYISVVGVESSTWGVSGFCAHIHRKSYGMCWNWFILSWESQWCISLPSCVFSDVRWVAWNWSCWEYLYHVDTISEVFPAFLGELFIKHLPVYHWCACLDCVCMKQEYLGIGGYVWDTHVNCEWGIWGYGPLYMCIDPGNCESLHCSYQVGLFFRARESP